MYPPVSSTRINIEEYFRNTLPCHIYQNLPFYFSFAFIYMVVLVMF